MIGVRAEAETGDDRERARAALLCGTPALEHEAARPLPESGAGAARVRRASEGIERAQVLETSEGQVRERIDTTGEDGIGAVIAQELEGEGDRDGAGRARVGLHAARTAKVVPAGEIIENRVDGVVDEEMAIGGCQSARDPLPVEALPESLTSQRGAQHDAEAFRIVGAAVE